MTEREQLEYAAKAMGLDAVPFFEDLATKDEDGDYAVKWNPLTDQADSDRMACKLRIDTYLSGSDGDSFYVEALTYSRVGRGKDFIIERHVNHNNTDEDVCRAVREARTAVAVEIGRAL